MKLRRLLLRLIGVPAAPEPQRRLPHRRNVPGPFYVADGCCVSCGIWELDAAAHFSWSEEDGGHCFVSRQPESEAEVRNIASAMARQELDCIRFCGADARWRRILEEAGLGEYLDPEA